jgi:hypothetical protein
VFGRKTIGLEELLWRFRYSKGLFVLGAGASAGIVPFDRKFTASPAIDFLDNLTSFAASPTDKDELTRRSIEAAVPLLLARRHQPWFDLDMAKAILNRLPSAFANFHVVHILAGARLKQRLENQRYRNYAVFDFFPPTLLLNYNLDGIATDICGAHHRVVPVHGMVDASLGSEETARLVARLREVDIDFRFEDLLLCVPEPHFGEPGHADLVRLLDPMWRCKPDFVAIIGYSFASQDPNTGRVYDDHESLRLFVERFKDYDGPVFVLDPSAATMERLEDRLRSCNVISVPYNWNILSAVMVHRLLGLGEDESLLDSYHRLIDLEGGNVSLPLRWKPSRKSVFAARGF